MSEIKKKIRRFIYHAKHWNRWRKHNLNSKLYKFCVLFGLAHSPTLEHEKVSDRIVLNAHEIFTKINAEIAQADRKVNKERRENNGRKRDS